MTHRAIDCLVNVHFGETATQPDFMLKVRDDYFKGPQSLYDQVELPELLDEMDAHGVVKAILMDNVVKPSTTARSFVEQRPDRFALAVGGIDLLRPVPALRDLAAIAADLPVAYAAVGPSFWGDGMYPRATRCTTRSTPSAPRSDCRCASTPAYRGHPSPVRCRTRSTWTGCACGSRNCGCA